MNTFLSDDVSVYTTSCLEVPIASGDGRENKDERMAAPAPTESSKDGRREVARHRPLT
jgi:hypothetical protein